MFQEVPASATYHPKTRVLAWSTKGSDVMFTLPGSGQRVLTGKTIIFRSFAGRHLLSLDFPNKSHAEKLFGQLLAPHIRGAVKV